MNKKLSNIVVNTFIYIEILVKVCYVLICIIICSKWEVTGNGDQLQKTLETAHR